MNIQSTRTIAKRESFEFDILVGPPRKQTLSRCTYRTALATVDLRLRYNTAACIPHVIDRRPLITILQRAVCWPADIYSWKRNEKSKERVLYLVLQPSRLQSTKRVSLYDGSVRNIVLH